MTRDRNVSVAALCSRPRHCGKALDANLAMVGLGAVAWMHYSRGRLAPHIG